MCLVLMCAYGVVLFDLFDPITYEQQHNWRTEDEVSKLCMAMQLQLCSKINE
jgi:hypothetical protein